MYTLQDGALDATELRTGLEALLKQSVTPERAQQLLVALDTNGDGVRLSLKVRYL
jgi:Ca2+-binding EF-hand superfamily protein